MTRTMRIVPVLDLKGGIVVHARRGDRAEYAPLRSRWSRGASRSRSRGRCAPCRTSSLYVADLDALAGAPADVATLAALAVVAEPWVDAGATTPGAAAALPRAGVARNVRRHRVDRARRPGRECAGGREPPPVLSVDLRDGRLISPDPELAGRDPAAAAPWRESSGCASCW